MRTDGSQVRQITANPVEEWGAVWMNALEISFLRQDEDQIRRVRKNLATGEEEIIDQPASCMLDDKNALYGSISGDLIYPCLGEIFLQSGTAIRSLTESIQGEANYPSWSADETFVLFTSNHSGNNDIYSYQVQTGDLIALTTNESNDERGALSPSGNLLAFSSDRFEKGNQDIALLNLDTKKVIRLTDSAGQDLIARWAGDNDHLLIGSNMDGNWEIYLLNIHNMELSRLTNNEDFDGDPRVF